MYLITPEQPKGIFPLSGQVKETVDRGRSTVRSVLK